MNYARQEDKPFRILAAFVALHSVESWKSVRPN
jgi:hypothetical protein